MPDLKKIREGKIKNLREEDLQSADLQKANLQAADLQYANLRKADLRAADLQYAELIGADLIEADLREAEFREADLRGAHLRGADLQWAIFFEADLRGADLRGADLRNTYLQKADLRGANLSGAKLLDNLDWLEINFDKTPDGWLVYKLIGTLTPYPVPSYWKIEPNSILKETCNFDRTDNCGCGISFGTRTWCEKFKFDHEVRPGRRLKTYTALTIWKCLIRWAWGPGICVPYTTYNCARCGQLELIERMTASAEGN